MHVFRRARAHACPPLISGRSFSCCRHITTSIEIKEDNDPRRHDTPLHTCLTTLRGFFFYSKPNNTNHTRLDQCQGQGNTKSCTAPQTQGYGAHYRYREPLILKLYILDILCISHSYCLFLLSLSSIYLYCMLIAPWG